MVEISDSAGLFLKVLPRALLTERSDLIERFRGFCNIMESSELGWRTMMISCRSCPLRREAIKPVPPEGKLDAELVIVGRNPGKDEDKYGRPFYPKAPAGRMLGRYLEALGWRRESAYITNACMCHSKEDRKPISPEIYTCLAWKFVEFDKLKNMRYLLICGTDACAQMFGADYPTIVRIFGDVYQTFVRGRKAMVIPVYHPAYLLRNPGLLQKVLWHLKKVGKLIQLDKEDRLKWLI